MSQEPPLRYYAQFGVGRLRGLGPIIDVEVRLPPATRILREKDQRIVVRGLIDTGASGSCISPHVGQALGLLPIEQIQMHGVNGVELANVYAVEFTFPGSGIVLTDWKVIEARGLKDRLYDMLIGRDVLRNFLFVYDGASGEIGLEFPSERHSLQKPPWTIIRQSPILPNPKKTKDKKKRQRKLSRASRKRNR